MKIGTPMFRYLVTSFKWRPKGVSSSGFVNLFLASAILKSRKDERSEEKRVNSDLGLVLSGRVLQSACALCRDQTSNSLISVLRCHPWISNADTTQYLKDL